MVSPQRFEPVLQFFFKGKKQIPMFTESEYYSGTLTYLKGEIPQKPAGEFFIFYTEKKRNNYEPWDPWLEFRRQKINSKMPRNFTIREWLEDDLMARPKRKTTAGLLGKDSRLTGRRMVGAHWISGSLQVCAAVSRLKFQ